MMRVQADLDEDSLFKVFFVSCSLSIVDQYAPWRVRAGIITILHATRCIKYWTTTHCGWKLQLLLSGINVLCTASIVALAPSSSLVLAEWIFETHVRPFWIMTFCCWLQDGSDPRVTLLRERGNFRFPIAICGSIVVSHPAWCCATCLSLATWVVGPMICLALALLPVERWRSGSNYSIDPIYPRLLQLAYNIWDFYQTLPGRLLEGLPHAMQANYSHYRQAGKVQKQLPAFQYDSLAANEIRLLVLRRPAFFLPGRIRATMMRVSKDCSIGFEAISYTWRKQKPTEEIIINDARFAVTRSALNVLIARRSVRKDRIIWIDAICINQEDPEEKSIQIGYMRDIYRQASRVLAFPSSNCRLRLLEPVLTHLASPNASRPFDRPMSWYLPPGPKSYPLQLRLLAYFFSLDYFGRAWIFQEIAVGSRIDVYLGGRYVSWDTLWAAIVTITPAEVEKLSYGVVSRVGVTERHTALSLEIRQNLKNITLMSTYRGTIQTRQGAACERGVFTTLNTTLGWAVASPSAEDLELALFYTHRFKATNGRDRVFSLLGVVRQDRPHALLRPDYKKSEEKVFQDAALYLLLHAKAPSINLLALAGTGYSERRKYSHSWVPDLTHERPCSTLTYSRWSGLEFRAADYRHASLSLGNMPGSISVAGVVIDKIVCLSPICMPKLSDTQVAETNVSPAVTEMEHVFRFIEGAISLTDRHKTKWPSLRTQLWRTLIADGSSETKAHQALLPEAFEILRSSKQLMILEDIRSIIPTFRALEASQGRDRVRNALKCLPSYIRCMQHVCEGRKFGITESGRICLAPPLVASGDMVFVAYGAQLPFILRPTVDFRSEKVHELLGEAYVDGIVQAELVKSNHRPTVVSIL